MSLFKLLAVLFLGVAVVGGGTYLVINNKTSTEVATEESVDSESETNEIFTGGESSLRGLMSLGQNIQCDFTSYTEETGGSVAGTVYVSGERIRGDFDMEQADATLASHLIVNGDQIYAWTVSPQGTHAYTFMLAEANDPEERSNSFVSLDDRVTYTCRAWEVQASKFELPGGIEFTSMEHLFESE